MRVSRVLVAAVLLPASVSAQAIALGIKAGPNSSRQAGWCCGDPNPFDARQGVAAGLTATVGVSPVLGLQVEALYAQKGIRGTAGFFMRQEYLELPVLVRATGVSGRAVSPVLLLGVAPAVELSCTGRTTQPTVAIAGIGAPPLVPLNCAEMRTYRGDVGLIGAVGADLDLGRAMWSAELRYSHGLSNLTRGWEYIPRTTNRSLALLLGVRRKSR